MSAQLHGADFTTGEGESDMDHLKARLFGLVLILLSIGLIYYNWQQLWRDGSYSMKLATFGPVVTVGGLFLMIAPTRAGKPTTTKEKITVLLVLVVGILAGLVNWYLMDPGFFGR
jgi:uncharacterized membrane protein